MAITFFTVLNALINYLTITVLAYFFGAGREIDAFFSATTLPQVILAILQVLIPATFIPVFIKGKTQDETNSWRVASIMTNVFIVILAGIAVFGAVFAKTIIPLINPGFPAVTAALSASLFSYFILAIIFSGAAIVLSSIHYAQKQFIRPLACPDHRQFCHTVFCFAASWTDRTRASPSGPSPDPSCSLPFSFPCCSTAAVIRCLLIFGKRDYFLICLDAPPAAGGFVL